LVEKQLSTQQIASLWGCSRDKIVWHANKNLIPINLDCCKYEYTKFLNFDKETAYFAGLLMADGCVKLKPNKVISLEVNDKCLVDSLKNFLNSTKKIYRKINKISKKSVYSFICNSSFIYENIKLWEILPNKSLKEKFPKVLTYYPELIDSWFIGLIDGDGSVFVTSKKLQIVCLCSNEILKNLLFYYKEYKPMVTYNCKNIEGLNNICFTGINAIKFYKNVYLKSGIHGLERKWSKPYAYIYNLLYFLKNKEGDSLNGNQIKTIKTIISEFEDFKDVKLKSLCKDINIKFKRLLNR
jgi:hypothetical protein